VTFGDLVHLLLGQIPGSALPSHAHWAASDPDAVRRASTGGRPSRARAGIGLAVIAPSTQLVDELVERRAEALERRVDVERLEQLWRSRGPARPRRRSRSAMTPGPAPRPSAVSSRSGGRSSACSRRPHASANARQRRRDVDRRPHVLELLGAENDPVEGVARPLASIRLRHSPLRGCCSDRRQPLPAHDSPAPATGCTAGFPA